MPDLQEPVCHPELPIADLAGAILPAPDCKKKLDFGESEREPDWKKPPDQEHCASFCRYSKTSYIV